MSHIVGELYILKNRTFGIEAGEFGFFLGGSKYMFVSSNTTQSGFWSNDFSKVEFSDKLQGKTACLTGTLDHPRDYYKKIIEINGGQYKTTAVKNLDYLIVSNNFLINEKYGAPSIKLTKARANGTMVLTFKEFLTILK